MARVDEKSLCLLVEIQLEGSSERGEEAGRLVRELLHHSGDRWEWEAAYSRKMEKANGTLTDSGGGTLAGFSDRLGQVKGKKGCLGGSGC